MPLDEMLRRTRERLAEAFPGRFRGLILYGSEAREEAAADSDVDLIVLLEGPVAFGKDLETVIRALYPLQLETDRLIDAWPADVKAYEAQEFSIFRRAHREGVLL
ncbi:MAG TPA: nucleotidyltransferase domain-containing protein [Phycisphaerae bacterium]|nr:nucleotidyltransferase domain-containing protein [Phycisphaerae bacterium]